MYLSTKVLSEYDHDPRTPDKLFDQADDSVVTLTFRVECHFYSVIFRTGLMTCFSWKGGRAQNESCSGGFGGSWAMNML